MKKRRNIYNPASSEPFKLSRSNVDLFLQCPRCFYLDRKLGISHPSGVPFTLNNAVDLLLKKEFDQYRDSKSVHPYIKDQSLGSDLTVKFGVRPDSMIVLRSVIFSGLSPNFKYRAMTDAVEELGSTASIKNMFIGFQQHLYQQIRVACP